jgi:hypothetical protein
LKSKQLLRLLHDPNGLFCLQVREENDLPASLLTLAASLSLCLEDGLGNLVPENLQGLQLSASSEVLYSKACLLRSSRS